MSLDQINTGSVENQTQTPEEKSLFELGQQFSDFDSKKQTEVVDALKTIMLVTRVDLAKASFDDVLSSVDLEEMEKGLPNAPSLVPGVAESLYLLARRENEKVGKLPFLKVKEYLEGQL